MNRDFDENFKKDFREIAGRDPDAGDVVELTRRMKIRELEERRQREEEDRRRQEEVERNRYEEALRDLDDQYPTDTSLDLDLSSLEGYDYSPLLEEASEVLKERRRKILDEVVRSRSRFLILKAIMNCLLRNIGDCIAPLAVAAVYALNSVFVSPLVFRLGPSNRSEGAEAFFNLFSPMALVPLEFLIVAFLYMICYSVLMGVRRVLDWIHLIRQRELDEIREQASIELGIELEGEKIGR